MSTLITGRAGIWFYQLAATRSALRVEVDTGLSHSRGSVLAAAQRRGWTTKRTKRGAVAELDWMVKGAEDENAGRPPDAPPRPSWANAAYVRGYYGHREQREPPAG
jgi:hypothetical protein